MTKQILRDILRAEIEKLKRVSYKNLPNLTREVEVREYGEGASFYEIEVQAFYDDAETGTLRIIVAVDDGGLSAFMPLTDDFLITPSGELL